MNTTENKLRKKELKIKIGYDNTNKKEIFKVYKLYEFENRWIESGADNEMIEYAKKLANFMVDAKKDVERVSSSQLRNIYGEIMRIKQKRYDNEKTSFLLLKPKVAYNYGRIKNSQQKKRFEVFLDDFNQAHALVEDEKTFDNFQKFFEAILAYHKFYGGK